MTIVCVQMRQVVKKNRNTLKSILASIVIACYIYTCIKIVYFMYLFIYFIYTFP